MDELPIESEQRSESPIQPLVSGETVIEEVEYSPVAGWLLIALALVVVGWLARSTVEVQDGRNGTTVAGHLAIDVNCASTEELQILPRIGPALADRIVQYVRVHGPVTCLEQLREIEGLGPRTIEELAPYLFFPPEKPDAEAIAFHAQSEQKDGRTNPQ